MHPRRQFEESISGSRPGFPYDDHGPRGTRRRRGDFPESDGPEGAQRPGGHRGDPRRGGGRGADFGPDFGRSFGRGFGPGFGPGPRGRGGRRAGRGEIRAAILLLLVEQPMHGYQVITELAERTDGRWRPSPGAVYPAISQLQDEGLVTVTDEGGRRLAALTDAGREHVESHRDELGTPWETVAADDAHRPGRELHDALRGLAGAVEQVARTGTADQARTAVTTLEGARREIYLLLAGPATTGEPAPEPGSEAAAHDEG